MLPGAIPPVALRRYLRFDSYGAFEAFDAELTRQLSTGQWVAVAPPTGRPLPGQATAYYQPLGAEQVWALSEPDNAWRGYFLPLEAALAHQRQLRRREQHRRWLGLAGLLLLGWGLLRACTVRP